MSEKENVVPQPQPETEGNNSNIKNSLSDIKLFDAIGRIFLPILIDSLTSRCTLARLELGSDTETSLIRLLGDAGFSFEHCPYCKLYFPVTTRMEHVITCEFGGE